MFGVIVPDAQAVMGAKHTGMMSLGDWNRFGCVDCWHSMYTHSTRAHTDVDRRTYV